RPASLMPAETRRGRGSVSASPGRFVVRLDPRSDAPRERTARESPHAGHWRSSWIPFVARGRVGLAGSGRITCVKTDVPGGSETGTNTVTLPGGGTVTTTVVAGGATRSRQPPPIPVAPELSP